MRFILVLVLLVALNPTMVKADQTDLLIRLELGQNQSNWYSAIANPEVTLEVYQPLNGGYPSTSWIRTDGERYLADGNPHSPYGTAHFEFSIMSKRPTTPLLTSQWYPNECPAGPTFVLTKIGTITRVTITPQVDSHLRELDITINAGESRTLETESSGELTIEVEGAACATTKWNLPSVWFASNSTSEFIR